MEKNQKENKKEKEQKIDFLVDFAYRGTENLSPKERELVVYARLEEMGFEAPKEVEEEVEEAKKSGRLGKYLLYGTIGLVVGGGAGYYWGKGDDSKPSPEIKPKTENIRPAVVQPKPAVDHKKTADYEKAREAMRRFDATTYEKLSANGKRVYDFIRENDPTPGKSYVILDKTRATLYLIDKNNKLTADSCVVISSHLGEEQNTSVQAKTGSRTTPAGIYAIGKKTGLQKKDAILYGGNIFTLWGISIKGDKVFLGWHQTYSNPNDPNEFKNRAEAMKKIAGETSKDPRKKGALSDGCINSPKEYFIKYAQKNIKGDGFELFYILPDIDPKTGKEPVFDPKGIIGKIKPVMVDVQKIERESI